MNVIPENHPKMKKYGIPKVPHLPGMNNVVLFRLPAEERTAGGIIMPDEHKPVNSRGILLAMGLTAYDKLNDALFEVGDEVTFAHYSGRDRDDKRRNAGEAAMQFFECKAEDVLCSVEGIERVKDFEIALDDDGNSMYQRKGK